MEKLATMRGKTQFTQRLRALFAKGRRGRILAGAFFGVCIATATIAGIAIGEEGHVEFRANGASCADAPEGNLCASGLCIDVSPFPAICTSYCTSDADCSGESVGCHQIRQGNGTWTGACTPRRIGAGE
jgi:hypothetical protein